MPKLHADGTTTDITLVVEELATEDVVPEREPAPDEQAEPAAAPAPERPASRRRTRGVGTKDS